MDDQPVTRTHINEIMAKEGDAPLNNSELMALNEFVGNQIMSRSDLMRKWLDPRRDINQECGYPGTTAEIDAKLIRLLYDRFEIATRFVEILPKESWERNPSVFEDDDPDKDTEFEKAWDELGDSLRGSTFHKQEEGSPIWQHLLRADILSGIGQFGVILLGFDDLEEDEQFTIPVQGFEDEVPEEPNEVGIKLLYMREFDESLVLITRYEQRKDNNRYGQPVEYLIQLNDPETTQNGVGLDQAAINVHWSRVIHIADNKGSSLVCGVPRCRPVWNRLLSLQKSYEGGGEMHWRGAFPGISFETNPQWGSDISVDVDKVKKAAERYMNTLQRYIIAEGMSVKSLAPAWADPSAFITTGLTALCIKDGIPMRVFMGSERGELASGQDDGAWNGRLKSRQESHITPEIICPFVDRMIFVGVLPAPDEENGYTVQWPDLDALKPQEQGAIALQHVQTIAAYISGQCDTIMSPMDLLTKELGFTDEEAEAILEAAVEHMGNVNPDADESELVPGHSPKPEIPEGMVAGPDGKPMIPKQFDPTMGNGKGSAIGGKKKAPVTKGAK